MDGAPGHGAARRPAGAGPDRERRRDSDVHDPGGRQPAWQWQQNGKDIAGATAVSYSVTANRAVKDAVFCCVVKNASGTLKSQPAKLAVKLKEPAPEVFAAWDKKRRSRQRYLFHF